MPLQTREETVRRLQELADATWSLAALRVLLERGVAGRLAAPIAPEDLEGPGALPPGLARAVLELLAAQELVSREGERFVAAPGLAALLDPAGLRWARADVRTSLLQSYQLGDRARHGTLTLGWSFTDP